MAEKPNFTARLFQPVNSFSADAFRMLFGLAMIFQFISFIKFDFIRVGILSPRFHFTYDFFDFVKPLSPAFMNLVMVLMLAGAFLITINKFYKAGILLFAISFSYLFFLDQSYYNNHFYLIILLSIILFFYKPVSAKDGNRLIPQWFIRLLQFQVIVVYFYGGLAKLNHDWLVDCQPMKTLLEANAANSLFPALLKSNFVVYYLTYGGIVFDLLIGFLLLYKPVLKVAIILNIFFHLTNFFIFNLGEGGDIGIFPLLMIFTNVLFIEPEKLQQLVSKYLRVKAENDAKKQKNKNKTFSHIIDFSSKKNIVLSCLACYILFQLLFPFRHFAYPGNTDWTGKAQRFSWRMKVYVKTGSVRITAKQSANDEPLEMDWKKHINQVQYAAMRDHPEMLLQFADYLKKLSVQLGFRTIILNAEVQVSMNGRPKQFVVDPSLDLLAVKRNPFKHAEWILPLKNNPK